MKTIIVTGATSGIGFAVCKSLLQAQYRVIGIGHTFDHCEKAKTLLRTEIPDQEVEFFYGDLMQQREVHRIADQLSEHIEKTSDSCLFGLIHNVGCVRSWYSTTEDGYEQQFALNHLAGFLLTHRLLKYLKNESGRILLTSSQSHQWMKIHWSDIMFQKGYHPLLAYKQSKLCNLLFAYALNTRYPSREIQAFCIDPGLVRTDIGNKKTGKLVSFVWNLRKAGGVLPEIPAETYRFLCDQKENPDGLYYKNCRKMPFSRQVNRQNAEQLFALSEQFCNIQFGV